MKDRLSRRSLLGTLTGAGVSAAAAMTVARQVSAQQPAADAPLAGNINHAVCKWCYGRIPLDDLCKASKAMGIKGIDLLGPNQWATAAKYGLVCSMANGAGMGIPRGFNRVEYHDRLVADYEKLIPMAAEAGLRNVICFSGNRDGIDDEEGAANCIEGLKRLMKLAEARKVNVVMELLNSRHDHKDYQCDHTEWGAKVCAGVGSPRMSLLYDIYHMQIMEGDIIAHVKEFSQYIGHYHTGGVPGRNEIDQTQEINYPAVMKAVVETGFDGFVAQEFVPKNENPLESLRAAVRICDV